MLQCFENEGKCIKGEFDNKLIEQGIKIVI